MRGTLLLLADAAATGVQAVAPNPSPTRPWTEILLYSPVLTALVVALVGSGIVSYLVSRAVERIRATNNDCLEGMRAANSSYLEEVKNSLAMSREQQLQHSRAHFEASIEYQQTATEVEALAREACRSLRNLVGAAPTISDNKLLLQQAALTLEAFSRYSVAHSEQFRILTQRHCPDVIAPFDALTTDFCAILILLSSDPTTRALPARQSKIHEAMERMQANVDAIEYRIARLSDPSHSTEHPTDA